MSGSTVWLVIGLCAVLTFGIKGAGPAAMGDRPLPAAVSGVVRLLAPALVAALVVTQTFADGRTLQVGARTVGVLVAAVLLWRRVSVLPAVLVAVAVTAGLRALGVA